MIKLADKLLWDKPPAERKKFAKILENDPVLVFEKHDDLFLKALNTLSWYELIELFGTKRLEQMLTADIINRIFPAKRREYYKNARRLLSKFTLSAAG
jgi:hypothetical protein